jgi:hypothetical protein
MSKEHKEEKEFKTEAKSSKRTKLKFLFKSYLGQYHPRLEKGIERRLQRKTIKVIEQDNKFFFWKELIQEYSDKKGMCIFLDDKSLLPDNLRNELINCIINEINLEINKLKLYITEVKNSINENKILPLYIKEQTILVSVLSINENINKLYLYVGKEKESKLLVDADYILEILKNRIRNVFEETDAKGLEDRLEATKEQWNKQILPVINNIINSKDFIKEFEQYYVDFMSYMLSDLVHNKNYFKDDYKNYFILSYNQLVKLKSKSKLELNDVKDMFFEPIKRTFTKDFNTELKSENLKSLWQEYKERIMINISVYNKDNNRENLLFSLHRDYTHFMNDYDEDLADEKASEYWNKIIYPALLEKLNQLVKGKEIKPSSKSKLCEFISDKNIEKHIQRRVIELIESTLARSVDKLKITYKGKIVKELETVSIRLKREQETEKEKLVERKESKRLERKKDIKPLVFQIYDTILARTEKNSGIRTVIDNIVNALQNSYVEKIILFEDQKYSKDRIFTSGSAIDKIKLISTYKFLKPFIFETELLTEQTPITPNIDSDIGFIKEYVKDVDFRSYKGFWESIGDVSLDDYLKYLIKELNMEPEILDIDISDTNDMKYIDETRYLIYRFKSYFEDKFPDLDYYDKSTEFYEKFIKEYQRSKGKVIKEHKEEKEGKKEKKNEKYWNYLENLDHNQLLKLIEDSKLKSKYIEMLDDPNILYATDDIIRKFLYENKKSEEKKQSWADITEQTEYEDYLETLSIFDLGRIIMRSADRHLIETYGSLTERTKSVLINIISNYYFRTGNAIYI